VSDVCVVVVVVMVCVCVQLCARVCVRARVCQHPQPPAACPRPVFTHRTPPCTRRHLHAHPSQAQRASLQKKLEERGADLEARKAALAAVRAGVRACVGWWCGRVCCAAVALCVSAFNAACHA
jgi:hypothetical protein